MKRNLILLATLGCIASAGARGTIDVKGVTYNVDTTFHAKVGPGTTQTSLQLRNGSNPLDVHYLTIDVTTPGVSIRSVCATDKVAGTARTSAMAESKSKNGVFYFAGANADFFSTSGTANNGKSIIGTPTTSTTVEREIYKTSNSNYQFSVDTAGVARVCRLNYYTGTATIGDKVTLFKGVNVMSPNNGITIYTPRYYGNANQGDYADNCNQVTAKLVEGDVFNAGGKFRLVVTSDPTTDGETAIPADGFVIHGRGTSKTGCNTGAKGFVGGLKKGDIVEFDNAILTPDNERIYPRTIVSGNPKNVGGGQTLDTEGERNDASARHPRTSIGVSEDGSKIIMMVVDGRCATSVGVTTSMLADVMRYAGAYEAVNLDGGGSSTLYTAALGVRNTCSDGSERAVGNAVFAVLEAPEDTEVAEIAFRDWAKRVPSLGLYEPVVYAYNKYGKLIDTNFAGFTLECDPAFGTISADGKGFMATGAGTGILTARAGAVSTPITVTIINDAEVAPKYSEVLLRDGYEWPVQLESDVENTIMTINPAAFTWTSGDAAVVTVNEDGVARGVDNGSTTITGTRGDKTINVKVTVERPTGNTMPAENETDLANWSVSKTSVGTCNLAKGDGAGALNVDYQLSSTRGPKVTLSRKVNLWSHPYAFGLTIDPTNAPVKSITLNVKANNDTRTVSKTIEDIKDGKNQYLFTFDDMMDLTDIGVYPIQFTSVAFGLGGVTKTDYHLPITDINAFYNITNDIDEISTDLPAGCPISIDGLTIKVAGNPTLLTVTDTAGRTLASTTASELTLPEGTRGAVIISAVIDDTLHTAKIAL